MLKETDFIGPRHQQRMGLESRACECYEAIRLETEATRLEMARLRELH